MYKLNDKSFSSWLKGALAVLYAKQGLAEFLEEIYRNLLNTLKINVPISCFCSTKCLQQYIKGHISTKPSWFENQSACSVFRNKICQHDRYEKRHGAECLDTKCYMPSCCCSDKMSLEETDFIGYLEIIVNINFFQKKMGQATNICREAQQVGRAIRDSRDRLLSKKDLASYIDKLLLLWDPRCLPLDARSQSAVQKLSQLKTNTLTIHENDITIALSGYTFDYQQSGTLQTIQSYFAKVKAGPVAEIDKIVNSVETEFWFIPQQIGTNIGTSPQSSSDNLNTLLPDLRKCLIDVYREQDAILEEIGYYVLPLFHELTNGRFLSSMKDLFLGKNQLQYKNIYVTANAGMGKTSFCRRIVLTWCQAHSQQDEIRDEFEYEDVQAMKMFDFVFMISMRDVQSCNVNDMIFDFISRNINRNQNYNEQLVEHLVQNENCLVILDGLDEWVRPSSCPRKLEVMPHSNDNLNCSILTTSRPWKFLRLQTQTGVRHIQLCDLTRNQSHTLVSNVLKKYELDDGVYHFNKWIAENGLEQFRFNAPIVIQLVPLWLNSCSAVKSRSELYSIIIESIIARCLRGLDLDITLFPEKTHIVPHCMQNKEYCLRKYPVLLKLGEFALRTLCDETEDDISKIENDRTFNCFTESDLHLFFEIGIISNDRMVSSIHYNKSFQHKSMQMFFATLYMRFLWKNEAKQEAILKASQCLRVSSESYIVIFDLFKEMDYETFAEMKMVIYSLYSGNVKPFGMDPSFRTSSILETMPIGRVSYTIHNENSDFVNGRSARSDVEHYYFNSRNVTTKRLLCLHERHACLHKKPAISELQERIFELTKVLKDLRYELKEQKEKHQLVELQEHDVALESMQSMVDCDERIRKPVSLRKLRKDMLSENSVLSFDKRNNAASRCRSLLPGKHSPSAGHSAEANLNTIPKTFSNGRIQTRSSPPRRDCTVFGPLKKGREGLSKKVSFDDGTQEEYLDDLKLPNPNPCLTDETDSKAFIKLQDKYSKQKEVENKNSEISEETLSSGYPATESSSSFKDVISGNSNSTSCENNDVSKELENRLAETSADYLKNKIHDCCNEEAYVCSDKRPGSNLNEELKRKTEVKEVSHREGLEYDLRNKRKFNEVIDIEKVTMHRQENDDESIETYITVSGNSREHYVKDNFKAVDILHGDKNCSQNESNGKGSVYSFQNAHWEKNCTKSTDEELANGNNEKSMAQVMFVHQSGISTEKESNKNSEPGIDSALISYSGCISQTIKHDVLIMPDVENPTKKYFELQERKTDIPVASDKNRDIELSLLNTNLIERSGKEHVHVESVYQLNLSSNNCSTRKGKRKYRDKEISQEKAIEGKRQYATPETLTISKQQVSPYPSKDVSPRGKTYLKRKGRQSRNLSSCTPSYTMDKKVYNAVSSSTDYDSGIECNFHSTNCYNSGIIDEISHTVPISGLRDEYMETNKQIPHKHTLHFKTHMFQRKKSINGLRIKVCKLKSKTWQNKYRKQMKSFFEDKGILTLKSFVKDLHIDHRKIPIFGLGSYFDRLNRGETLSDRERMQYEWLRLASFQNYTGNGNALSLARNGFYHDPNDGPTVTRCYLCEVSHSTWEYFDNIEAQHRRQSPQCPFHANRNEESTNVSISHDNSLQPPRIPQTSIAIVNSTNSSTAMQTVSAISSSSVSTSSIGSLVTNTYTNNASGSLAISVKEAIRGISQAHLSSQRHESLVYQPQENDENREHSILALLNSRSFRVLGRSEETAYSHLTTPPRRNNIAAGATSNASLDASPSNIPTSTASTLFRPSSLPGGPDGAGPTASDTALISKAASRSATSTTQSSGAALAAAGSLLRPPQPQGGGGRTDPTITVVVNNPKHPDYRELDARINSYQGWPDYLDQTPRQMAEAGFYFVGVADFTRCFCCGGGLRNWEPGDDPMLEHTRWFPRCEYVNKLKGQRYVAAVQRRHQEHMAAQQREQLELAQQRDTNRNPPDPMTTEAAAVLHEMGYQTERIRDAILAVRRQIGVPDVTTQQVLAWLLEQHEGRSPPTSSRSSPTRDLGVKVNIAGTSASSTVSSASTAAAESKITNQSNSKLNETKESKTFEKLSAATGAGGDSDEEFNSAKETLSAEAISTETKATKTNTSKSSDSSKRPDIDTKTLKEENEKLREMQTCKICMERLVNTTLLPCGHLVCCDICASRLNRCPICRKRINGTVKTFMS